MDTIPPELRKLLNKGSNEKNLITFFCALIDAGISPTDIFGEEIEIINERLNREYGKIILKRKGMNIQMLNQLSEFFRKKAKEMRRKH
jgi:hypothetical protein